MKTKKKYLDEDKLTIIALLDNLTGNMTETEITANSAELKVIIIDMITTLLDTPTDPVALQNAMLNAAEKLNKIVGKGEAEAKPEKAKDNNRHILYKA